MSRNTYVKMKKPDNRHELTLLHLLLNRGILCVLRVVLMVILHVRLHPSLALSLVRIIDSLQRNGN